MLSTLEQVRNSLKNIPMLHYGGCGIAAYFMYKWVKNNQPNKEVKVVYMYQSTGQLSYITNQELLNTDSEGAPAGCTHACIFIDGKLMDCMQEFEKTEFEVYHFIDDEDFILRSIANAPTWNDTFNRRRYIPLMEERIGIKLCI